MSIFVKWRSLIFIDQAYQSSPIPSGFWISYYNEKDLPNSKILKTLFIFSPVVFIIIFVNDSSIHQIFIVQLLCVRHHTLVNKTDKSLHL